LARLVLLRHGALESAGGDGRAARGQIDAPLGARGLAEQERLVAHLTAGGRAPDQVFSSDLERCAGLARALAESSGAPLQLCAALREQSLGTWEGRPWEVLQREDPEGVARHWREFVDGAPPGGESFRQVAERVLAWWETVREQALDRELWVVTHAGPIRALVSAALGMPLGEALRLAPATGSCTRLLWSEAGWVLEVFGERPV
jgi:alpha-ribazole phosphatase